MNLEEIRRTFDKGSIIFKNNKLSVFYMCVEGCGVVQNITNTHRGNVQQNYKTVLRDLIAASDDLVFRVSPGGKMYIDFVVTREQITDKTCWFLPIAKQLSAEDYERIRKEAGDEVLPEYREIFDRHFQEFDSLDGDEQKSLVREWLDYILRSDEVHDNTIASRTMWPRLVEACRRFFKVTPLGEMVINNPDPDTYGFVEFQITADKSVKCQISGEKKLLFLSMVECADTIGIEITCDGPKITFVDLDFFSR